MSKSSRQIIKEAGGSAVFSNVVVTGNLVYLAGVIGQKDGKLVSGGIEAETPQAFEVAKERLATVGLDLTDGECAPLPRSRSRQRHDLRQRLQEQPHWPKQGGPTSCECD